MIDHSTDLMPREIPHLSYSQFQTLSQCGMKYLIEKGYNEFGVPNWAAVGGSAVHKLTEWWDKELYPSTEYDLYRQWRYYFELAITEEEERSGVERGLFRTTGRASKAWPNKHDMAWWDENGPIYVNNWMGWRAASPWVIEEVAHTPAIELGFEMVIGDAPVKGGIDRVFRTPQNDLVIVDLKTGMEPSGYVQLGVYHAALRRAWPIPAKETVYGAYWMAPTNELTTPIDLSYMDNNYLDQQFWRADQIRKQGLFLTVVDKHCGWCSAKRFCPAFGGELPDAGLVATLDKQANESEEDTSE